MKRRVVVVAASLLVGGTATAGADTSQPGSYDGPLRIVAGPVLMGDEIAWATESTRSIGNSKFTVTGRLYAAPVRAARRDRSHSGPDVQ